MKFLGQNYLNPVSEVYNDLLKRQSFNASKSTNLLFTVFGFHFFLQFLSHGNLHGASKITNCILKKILLLWFVIFIIIFPQITCSHIYANHKRTYHKGKIVTEVYDEEEYPIFLQRTLKKTFANHLVSLRNKFRNCLIWKVF